jgi:hypothetical protein
MKTSLLVLAIISGLALASVSQAQSFTFSGATTPTSPFQLGTLCYSTNTFFVEQQSGVGGFIGGPGFPLNGFQSGDLFGFTLASNSIVTLTFTPGENFAQMSFILDGGEGLSVSYVNPYDTVGGSVALPAGSYLFRTTGSIPDYDQAPPYFAPNYPYVYGFDYSGSIAVVPVPIVNINNISVALSANGGTNVNFIVSLSKVCPSPVMVDYSTSAGTAIANVDFGPVATTLTFQPGETTQPITVGIIGADVNVPEATFFMNLFNPVNATIGQGQGTATILNEDYPPSVQSVAQTNGTIQLIWSIVPGQTYQLQSNTDLTSTNWVNLGGCVTATSITASASDSMTNSRCFYRVMLVQ